MLVKTNKMVTVNIELSEEEATYLLALLAFTSGASDVAMFYYKLYNELDGKLEMNNNIGNLYTFEYKDKYGALQVSKK